MRIRAIFACLLTAVLVLGLFPLGAMAATSGLDVVILIDRSGTMRKTDPENIAQEAAKQFIDLCEMQNTSVAMLGFNQQIVNGSEANFVTVDSSANRDALKAVVDKFPKSGNLSKEDTDTGLALQTAYDLISARRTQYPDHQFAILLLSDGEIDFSTSTEGTAENELMIGQSRDEANRVCDQCAQEGTKIFCIGLYNEKDPTAVPNRGDLDYWAATTNGQVEVVGNASELPNVLTKFFEVINQSIISQLDPEKENGKTLYKVQVPDNVLETNIVIAMKDKNGMGSVSLYNPSDHQVPLNANSRNIIISDKSDTYKSIKIQLPEKGDWKLFLNKDFKDIKVTMVNNFDLNMKLTLNGAQLQKNEKFTATLDAQRQNIPYDGAGNEVLLMILDNSGQVVDSMPMVYDTNTRRHTVDYQAKTAGNWTAIAQIQTDNMLNVSNEVPFEVLNNPIGLTSVALPEPIVIRDWMPVSDGHEAVVTDALSELFIDKDGDAYHVITSVDPNGEKLVEAKVDGDRLLLRGLAQGEAKLTISAQSDDGTSAAIHCTVQLTDYREMFKRYALFALAGLAVLILIIILLVRASKPSFRRYSSIGITIQDAMSGDVGSDTISLQRFGKKRVKLSQLAGGILRNTTGLRGYGNLLNKITIEPTKSENIRVRCALKPCKGDTGLAPGDTKSLDLQGNGSMIVLIEYT